MDTAHMPARLLTDVQVAEIVGLAPATLRKMRLASGGPPFRKIGSAVRYELHEVEAWIRSRPLCTSTAHAVAPTRIP
jgi:predicted DNA-binding transcriptional regulator AlpA